MLRKLIVASLAVGSLMFTPEIIGLNVMPVVQAEVKTFTGIGDCVQNELVITEQARKYAKFQAERNAKEQAGIFVSAYLQVEGFKFSDNEIEAIVERAIKITGVEYERSVKFFGDEPIIVHTAKVSASIDTSDIDKWIIDNERK